MQVRRVLQQQQMLQAAGDVNGLGAVLQSNPGDINTQKFQEHLCCTLPCISAHPAGQTDPLLQESALVLTMANAPVHCQTWSSCAYYNMSCFVLLLQSGTLKSA